MYRAPESYQHLPLSRTPQSPLLGGLAQQSVLSVSPCCELVSRITLLAATENLETAIYNGGGPVTRTPTYTAALQKVSPIMYTIPSTYAATDSDVPSQQASRMAGRTGSPYVRLRITKWSGS